MERTLKDLSVEGVKTRKKPNKHIVFAVKVMWSDGQVNVVSRRYSEFFELMERLNDTFPEEAGKHEQKKRILPNLQAKKTFLLNSSVMKQLERITLFTKKLVLLPDHISQCFIVRTFFTPTEADIESTRKLSIQNPKTKSRNWRRKNTAKQVLSISGPVSLEQYRVIADVVDGGKKGLDLKQGQIVDVIEKLETGWWLVTADGEQGWVPASYLSNEDDPEETMTTIKYEPGQGECYVTNASYTATFKDELSFDIGVHLQVIEKNLDGWWRAIYNGCEGLVPAAYLKKVGENRFKHENKPPPVRKINVLSQKHSVGSEGEMTIETLAKLRESTFRSPEEKDEGMLTKKKLFKPGKGHLELKTSVDGGWVPQVIPAPRPIEKEKEVSQDKEKGFSLLRGLGHLRKPRRDEESDAKKNRLHLHLPQRSKSVASDLKSLKKSSAVVMGEKGKVPAPVHVEQAPRPKSMVEELMLKNSPMKNEKAPQESKSSDRKEKYYKRWSVSEEGNFHMLPSKEEDHKDAENIGVSQFKTRSTSDLCNEFQFEPQMPKQDACSACEDASVCDSPMFVVTPPTPQNTKKSNVSDQVSDACKKRLDRKKSYSCSNLTSPSKGLEANAFEDHEDEDNYLEDYDSSDEDICTLEDLLNEERESKGSGFYHEELPDAKEKMWKERGSYDSGMGSSPPSTPEPIIIPQTSAANNMYVVIADYEGSKEDGEVDLFEGQQVKVLQKTVGGWWLVEDDAEQRGWAPSNFLERCNNQQLDQTFCYVGNSMESLGVPGDIERNAIKLPNGEELQVLDVNENGRYILVKVPSKFAWISKNGPPECKL